MLELARTVRFCLNDDPAEDPAHAPRDNTFSAWPAMRGLGRYYELTVRCAGEADPSTGYFINIKHIDEAVRDHALPELHRFLQRETAPARLPMGAVMQQLVDRLQPPLNHTVATVSLWLTPRYALQIGSHALSQLTLRQQYEFSAAHRLHVPELSEQENQRIFGKCTNPAGHGHNYQMEVLVSAQIDQHGHVPAIEQLDATVNQHVLARLDHKHLNEDVPEFADLNPTVEHIAQVIWQRLEQPVAELDPERPLKLERISVWETEKTVCTYNGPERAPASTQQ